MAQGLGQLVDRLEGGLTKERYRALAMISILWGVVLFGYWGYQIVTAWDGRVPVGRDFSAFWSAAVLGLGGQGLGAFDPSIIGPMEQGAAAVDGILYWHYPPTYHGLVLPFGLLPYPAALVLFMAFSMAAWAYCVRRLMPDAGLMDLAPALFAPAMMMNLNQGQNGAIIALFVLMALLAIERRQRIGSAAWISMMLIKPHFAVLFPVALIAGKRLGIFVATGMMCLVLLTITTLYFGLDYWRAFFANAALLKNAVNSGGLWDQQFSGYAFTAKLGGPDLMASIVQLTGAAIAAVLTWRVWSRNRHSFNLKAATFIIASLMISPYAFHYDLVISVAALIFLVREAQITTFLRGEKILFLGLWFAPFVNELLAGATSVLLLYPIMIGMLGVCWRRARLEKG